jgi:hypothetical protein
MKKFRLIIAAVSAIIFIASLFIIDYQSIISRSNLGAFLVIFSSALNIIAKILSNRYEKKHQVKQSKESNYLQQRKEKTLMLINRNLFGLQDPARSTCWTTLRQVQGIAPAGRRAMHLLTVFYDFCG